MQAGITSAIEAWMLRHALLPAGRVAGLARVIGTFCWRCSPHQGEHEIWRPEDHHVVARLLAVLLCLDDPAPGPAGARAEILGAIERDLPAIRAGLQPAAISWLHAVSELLQGVAGPTGRDIEIFVAALLDHWGAAQEEAMGQEGGAGAHAWTAPRDWLADYLRLRPLVIGTEPYLRCWQTLLGCWPDVALVRALEAEAPALRRAYPHAVLDHALGAARQAHARGRTRRSPALSELDALVVVSTYLANDLGSRERDRDADGPGREPNLVLLLERYFLGGTGGNGADPHAGVALERAEATVVDMYNIGISRFRAFRTCALATQDGAGTRQYLALLARIVDGNLHSTIDLAGDLAGSHAGAHPDAGATAAGLEPGPRYSALETLKRLHRISDES